MMRLLSVLVFSLLGCELLGCAEVPQPWEHGYKTSRVVATRTRNSLMGQFVKLEFPKNGYDSDREEVSQFIEMHGGVVFEGGGYPFAPAYVQFRGVSDRAALDKKLQEMLPGLSDLLANLDNQSYTKSFKKKYKAWDLAHNPQWPDTTPPDKTDPYWEFNNNLNENGTQYKKVEVSPGKWQWKVNEESMRLIAEEEHAKWKLFHALSERKLTHAELMSVYAGMNTANMQPYFQVDVDAEMYDALAKQWELQTGQRMAGYRPLSTAKGEYNRSPQEADNRRAVESLIRELQDMTDTSPKPSDKVAVVDAEDKLAK